MPKTWLKTLDAYIQNHHPKMIVGPVTYKQPETLLHGFQLMDFLSLQGATIGGFGLGKPFLSNGANFAYTHQLFNDLKGFSGNTNIASGDDIFLLEKAIHHDKNSVHYIKSDDLLITTNPQSSIYNLIQQRMRWAAKTTSYKNSFGRGVGLIVLLMNFLIIVALIMSIIGLITVTVFISVFVFKFIIDICLIYKSAKLFNQTSSLSYYFFSSICYPFFSVFIGIYSLFFHFNWKDRRFSK